MALRAFGLLPRAADVHGMFEFHTFEVAFPFSWRTLSNDRVTSGALVDYRLAVCTGVVAVVTTVAAGKVPVAEIVGIDVPCDFHRGKEVLSVNQLGFGNGLGDEPRIVLSKLGIF